jgi:hypothetical protein
MNINEIQMWVAPILTPAAPATLLGNSLYRGMIVDGVAPNLALVVSVAAAIGTEFAGAIAARAGVEAYRKKKLAHMWLAIVSTIVYAIFVFSGIYNNPHAKAFAASVFVSLIAYLGVAIYQDLQRSEEDRLASVNKEIELLDAERKLQNAQNRGAKLSSGQGNLSIGRTGQTGQTGQGLNPEKLERARQFLEEHPDATTRDVAAAIGVASPTTGKAYRDAILKQGVRS